MNDKRNFATQISETHRGLKHKWNNKNLQIIVDKVSNIAKKKKCNDILKR